MTVAAREVDRFVTVVPSHPIVLVAAVAGHNFDNLTLTAGLTDVDALDNDSVTPSCMHGNPPFRALPSPLLHTAPAAAGELPQAGALREHENSQAGV
jgi:hypothetical protein